MRMAVTVGVSALIGFTAALTGCSLGTRSSPAPMATATAPADRQAAGGSAGRELIGASPGAGNGANAISLHPSAVIKTADLTIRTKDVRGQAEQAIQIATVAGGDLSSQLQTDAPNTNTGRADLVLTVPPRTLESVLTQLDGLGTELARRTATEDVTGQVADVTSRAASAQASITRLQTLFSQAANVTDIVALESELAQREADLESLQAQQKALTAETASATITLHLLGTGEAAPVTRSGSARGFGGGLSRGWQAFTGIGAWALTALGAVLPFLLVIALLGGGVWLIRRRRGVADAGNSGGPPAVGLLTTSPASGPGVGQ